MNYQRSMRIHKLAFLNEEFTNLNPNNYKFNSFLELTQGLLIPINNYVLIPPLTVRMVKV